MNLNWFCQILGLMLSGGIIVAAVPTPASALDFRISSPPIECPTNDDDPTRPRMSTSVSVIMQAILEAASNKNWTLAGAKLAEVRALSGISDVDQFEIDVVAGFISINTGDHVSALAAYNRVITSPLFQRAQTLREQVATLRNAMILSNEVGDFQLAIAIGEKLAAMGPMDDASAGALALAYFGNKDFSKATILAQKAIDAALAAGKKPDEASVQIVRRTNVTSN